MRSLLTLQWKALGKVPPHRTQVMSTHATGDAYVAIHLTQLKSQVSYHYYTQYTLHTYSANAIFGFRILSMNSFPGYQPQQPKSRSSITTPSIIPVL